MTRTAPSQDVPRLSIGMPLYNATKYLEESFRSLLAQDFTDFELIVSDNASTDGTWEICERFAATDPRVRLHRNERNLGVAANFNTVARLARGELFKWLAYDDLMEPSFLSACVAELDRSDARTVLAYPRTRLIDDAGQHVSDYEDDLDIRKRFAFRRVGAFAWRWDLCNPIYGLIRRDALMRTGLERPYVSGDVPLLFELALLGEFHEVPERLFLRRFHAASSPENAEAFYHPNARRRRSFPRGQGTARILSALLNADAPVAVRWASAASFLSVWGLRNARRLAGRRYRALLVAGDSDRRHGVLRGAG
jgi:glycosyltransferase involved in cell wall biosynthesis